MSESPLDRQTSGPLARQAYRLPREDSKCVLYGPLRYDKPDPAWLERIEPLLAYVQEKFPDPAKTRLLDAGCEDGAMATRLKNLGFDIWVIDQDIAGVATARANGVPGEVLSIYDFRLTGPWDAVILSDVLEHLPWPQQALENLARVTNKLILTTPEIASCPGTPANQIRATATIKGKEVEGHQCQVCGAVRASVMVGGVCGKPNYKSLSAWHATEFTEKTLTKVLERSGWKIAALHKIRGSDRIYFLVDCKPA